MVALLAAICFSQVADLAADKRLDQVVSYTTGGQNLSQALRGVSEKAGLKLSVADPFDEDIVALRLSDAPLREFMTRLSSSLKLNWRATNEGYTIYQTTERAKEATKELATERIGRLRALRKEHESRFKLPRPDFDELQRLLAIEMAEPLPDPNKDIKTYLERAKEMEKLRVEGDPSTWFGSAVIASLSDAQMHELLDAGSISFSPKPNRLQHPTPKQAQVDIDNWARQTANFTATGGARIRMVDGRQVKVTVYISSEGKSIGANELFLDLNDYPLPQNTREPKDTRLDEKLDIEGFLGGRWRMPDSRKPSEKVLVAMFEAYEHPELREPLSVMAGDGLVEIAAETDNQLIALLGDDMIALGTEGMQPTNGRQLLAQYCDGVRAVYAEAGGWLTVRPQELSLSRAKQFPRKFLAQGAAARKRGLLTQRELADIVNQCTDMHLEGRFFTDFLTDCAARREGTMLRTWGDLAALRLWHSFSGSEMEGIRGGGVPIGRLDSVSKKLLWRAVSLRGTTIAGDSAFPGVFRRPSGHDPTRVFPNGFPADEVLEVYFAQDDCVLASFTPTRRSYWISQSVERFAGFAGQNNADMSKVRLGRTEKMSLVVDKLCWWADFREDLYDFSKPMTDWKEAPEALRKRFEAAKRNPPQSGYIIR